MKTLLISIKTLLVAVGFLFALFIAGFLLAVAFKGIVIAILTAFVLSLSYGFVKEHWS